MFFCLALTLCLPLTGTFEMAQLWLNLPASKKMNKPKYQPIVAKNIPVVPLYRVADPKATPAAAPAAAAATGEEAEGANAMETKCENPDAADGSVRLIAGNLNGVKGSAKTESPVELWDATLKVNVLECSRSLRISYEAHLFLLLNSLSCTRFSFFPLIIRIALSPFSR